MKATPELSIQRCLNLISFTVARGNSLRDQHPLTSRDCRLHKSHMVSDRDTNSLQPSKFRCLKCINFPTSFGISSIEDPARCNDLMHVNCLITSGSAAPSHGSPLLSIKRLRRPFAL
ncbi:hypothetical protein OIU84_002945 [Salix udensis]|uniref:Uncharacterized protein n=1 Tax=Salix udensis TaxID=889485 RepID=A0AAD6K7F9_9ROSI|nr:hypothetical protein OIU84_002945 [Salix udensis]